MRRERTCLICGTLYHPSGSKQKYCPECAKLKSAGKYTEREIRIMVQTQRIQGRGNQSAIAEIESWAREIGMHYGQYVGRYGARPPEVVCPKRLAQYRALYTRPTHGWKAKKADI